MASKSKKTQGGTPAEEGIALRDWHCVAIVLLLVAIFFREILLQQAFFWEDFLYQNYPFRVFAATSMAMGELPLWNPFTFNGMPFLADIQTTVLYLPCTILALFVREGSLHFYWLEVVIILHYVLAGISMFFLARSFHLDRLPALFAGVAYMFSGFMVMHGIHQQIITLAAWFPLVVLCFRRALESGRWLWVFLTALLLGHSTLAGFPQLSLYLYGFLGLIFLLELAVRRRESPLQSLVPMTVRAVAVIILSLGLAMVQLLPTFELSDLSQRAQITYEKSTEGSLSWAQLITLAIPGFYGTVHAAGRTYWGPGAYWYFWETCIYVGLPVLMLTLVSLLLWRTNRYIPFLLGVGVVSLLYGLGSDFILHRLFFDSVPGFSRFRNPARATILLAFAASLLSAFSFQAILSGEAPAKLVRQGRVIVLVLMGGVVAAWLFAVSGVMAGLLGNPAGADVGSVVQNASAASALVGVVSGAILLLLLRQSKKAALLGLALTAVLFLDLWSFGGEHNNASVNPGTYFRQREQLIRMLKEEGKNELFRVNTRNAQGMVMDRNQGMVDRIFQMEGYTPLALERMYAPITNDTVSLDLLNVKYRTVTNEAQRTLALVRHPTYFPRAYFRSQVHIARGDEELRQYLNSPAFDHHRIAVLEEDPGWTLTPPPAEPVQNIVFTEYRGNSMSLAVETSHDALLVFSEMFYPGWTAYVDGSRTPIHRTNYNLRGVFVPRGAHSVDVRFEPQSFATGSILSLGMLIVCGAGIFFSVKKRG